MPLQEGYRNSDSRIQIGFLIDQLMSTPLQNIEAGKLKTTIKLNDLVVAGLVHKNDKVKLLGRGDLEQKFEIEVHAASDSAKEKVEKAGGTITIA